MRIPFPSEILHVSTILGLKSPYRYLSHPSRILHFFWFWDFKVSSVNRGLKDCFSCFGLSYNKKFKDYSIGINVDDELFSKLKAVEAKAETFLDRPLKKPLLRCLIEKGDYKTLYLKPKEFDEKVLDERSVVVSAS